MQLPYGTTHRITGFHEPEGTAGISEDGSLSYLRIFLRPREDGQQRTADSSF